MKIRESSLAELPVNWLIGKTAMTLLKSRMEMRNMEKRSAFGWAELILGIIFLVLGFYTLSRPLTTALAVVIGYAIGALVTGITDIIAFFRPKRENSVFSLVAGILSLVVGILLLSRPLEGTIMATVLFPIWFIVHCLVNIANLNYIRELKGKGVYIVTLVINILALISGVFMIGNLFVSLSVMTFMVSFYFLMEGAGSIVLAFGKSKEVK